MNRPKCKVCGSIRATLRQYGQRFECADVRGCERRRMTARLRLLLRAAVNEAAYGKDPKVRYEAQERIAGLQFAIDKVRR